jgi:NAD(P)-dependent dehydrogenase (short-subunit alcohol dehydrogenase family)
MCYARLMPTALITGGNRGIGLETCRALAAQGLSVVLTARDRRLGEQAAAELEVSETQAIRFELLDVTDEAAVLDCAHRLEDAGVQIDVLVNNAGVYPEGKLLEPDGRVAMEDALLANFWGAFWCCQEFVPAMVERGYGRVVNVTSGYGSFGEGLEGPAAYCVSKAALNALTVKLAREVQGDVKVNAVCPGWVRTRMGGAGADIAPEDATGTIVWLATLPADGPNGGFFRDRQPVPW